MKLKGREQTQRWLVASGRECISLTPQKASSEAAAVLRPHLGEAAAGLWQPVRARRVVTEAPGGEPRQPGVLQCRALSPPAVRTSDTPHRGGGAEPSSAQGASDFPCPSLHGIAQRPLVSSLLRKKRSKPLEKHGRLLITFWKLLRVTSFKGPEMMPKLSSSALTTDGKS